MDLYSFANGDPINFVDPTGREAGMQAKDSVVGTAFASISQSELAELRASLGPISLPDKDPGDYTYSDLRQAANYYYDQAHKAYKDENIYASNYAFNLAREYGGQASRLSKGRMLYDIMNFATGNDAPSIGLDDFSVSSEGGESLMNLGGLMPSEGDIGPGGPGGKAFKQLAKTKKAANTVANSSKVFDNAAGFADEITALNKATDGGGALMGGSSPMSALQSASYYDDVAEQGASIFRSIAGNHMFANGNKRTAVGALQSFAEQSGLTINRTHDELMDIATQVATGQLNDVSDIARALTK